MPESLSLRFFGPPHVSVQGHSLRRLRSRKGLHLLALLALRMGSAVERDFLIGTLWPESDASAGQESLRKTLSDLRAALASEADRLTTPRRGTLQLDLSNDAFCDTAVFDAAVIRWEKSGDIAQAELAASLYRGPFMEGTTEEWVLRERCVREESARAILETLARRALESADIARTLALARRAEKIEPLRESVQRLLYRALTEAGDFPAAQRAYRDFRVRLRGEANLSPDPKTVALMQTLANTPRRAGYPPSVATEEGAEHPQVPLASEGLRHFPRFLTPLRGREPEQERLRESLKSMPLITLVGMGGMGKTRLAVAVAQERSTAVFVDLSPLSRTASPEDISQALCRAVGVAGEDTTERLRELVRESDLLLLLDNGEPVLESLRVVLGGLLQPEQRARLLVTSREPLGLRGERILRLEPLPEEQSLVLFQERAEAVGVRFNNEDQETIRAICARLEGLPLAIELAAARSALLSPPRLLERLASPLRLLSGAHPDLPERQRSLRAILESSCALLEPHERAGFEALSVFIGPFALEDAEAVLEPHTTEALDLLEALYRASLLVVRASGWTFLQPVREFAAEALAVDPTRSWDLHHRHAQQQARVALAALTDLRRGALGAARRLWEYAEDRAAAFLWAQEAQQGELAAQLAWTQACYLMQACRTHEAENLLEKGLTLTQTPALQQTILEECAELALGQGQITLAQQRIEQARALHPIPRSGLLCLQGKLAFSQGHNHAAHAPFWEGFTQALAEGNPQSAVQILAHYTNQVRRRSEPLLLEQLTTSLERAGEYLEQLLSRDRTQGALLQAMAVIHRLRGNRDAAVTSLEELVALRASQQQAELLADAYFRLGAQLLRVERPEEAEAAILQSSEGFRRLGNAETARHVLVEGLCAAKFTRWFGQAMRLRQELLPEQRLLDPSYFARMVLFEACVLMRYGTPTEARERLLEASLRFRWLGDPVNETIMTRLAAWTYLDEGDLERGHSIAQKLCNETGQTYQEEVGRRKVFLAECLRRAGQPHAALTLLEALEGIPEAQIARGLCLLDQDRDAEAEQELTLVRTLGEIEVSVEWLGYASLGLATLAQRRGQDGIAEAGYHAVLTRALRAKDRVGEQRTRAALQLFSRQI